MKKYNKIIIFTLLNVILLLAINLVIPKSVYEVQQLQQKNIIKKSNSYEIKTLNYTETETRTWIKAAKWCKKYNSTVNLPFKRFTIAENNISQEQFKKINLKLEIPYLYIDNDIFSNYRSGFKKKIFLNSIPITEKWTEIKQTDYPNRDYFENVWSTVVNHDQIAAQFHFYLRRLTWNTFDFKAKIIYGSGNYGFAESSASSGYWGMGPISIKYDLFNPKSKYEEIKQFLTNKISFNSSTSPSIIDNSVNNQTSIGNKTNILNIINERISHIKLKYNVLKNFNLEYYNFNSYQNIVTLKTSFYDWFNNKITWNFDIPINITVKKIYYTKDVLNNIFLETGLMISPSNNLKYEKNEAIKISSNSSQNSSYANAGIWELHSNSTFIYVSNNYDDYENEYLKINNQNAISVLDGKWQFKMLDLRLENIQTTFIFDIFGDIKSNNSKNQHLGQITFKLVMINSDLILKWYGWKPEINIEQKELITEFLKDGTKNSNYNPLINKISGNINELLWVSKKPEHVMYIDPLDINGNLINKSNQWTQNELNNINWGYIAQGSVISKGIEQLFDSKTNVLRTKLNNLNSNRNWININSQRNKIFDKSGLYEYNVSANRGNNSRYIVDIGQNNNNLLKLSQLYPNSIITHFWETFHGIHLHNYLIEQGLTSEILKKLTYQQVLVYWRQYTTTIASQNSTQEVGAATFNLQSLKILPIKFYLTNLDEIRNEIISQISEIINYEVIKFNKLNNVNLKLIYGIDYIFENLGNDKLENLLKFNNDRSTILLTLKSLKTFKVFNSKKIKIENYDKKIGSQMLNLKLTHFNNLNFNINSTNYIITIEKIKNFIISEIENQLHKLNTSINYKDDFVLLRSIENVYFQFKTYQKGELLLDKSGNLFIVNKLAENQNLTNNEFFSKINLNDLNSEIFLNDLAINLINEQLIENQSCKIFIFANSQSHRLNGHNSFNATNSNILPPTITPQQEKDLLDLSSLTNLIFEFDQETIPMLKNLIIEKVNIEIENKFNIKSNYGDNYEIIDFDLKLNQLENNFRNLKLKIVPKTFIDDSGNKIHSIFKNFKNIKIKINSIIPSKTPQINENNQIEIENLLSDKVDISTWKLNKKIDFENVSDFEIIKTELQNFVNSQVKILINKKIKQMEIILNSKTDIYQKKELLNQIKILKNLILTQNSFLITSNPGYQRLNLNQTSKYISKISENKPELNLQIQISPTIEIAKKLKGSLSFLITNKFNLEIVDKENYFDNKTNIAWVSSVVTITIIILIFFLWLIKNKIKRKI